MVEEVPVHAGHLCDGVEQAPVVLGDVVETHPARCRTRGDKQCGNGIRIGLEATRDLEGHQTTHAVTEECDRARGTVRGADHRVHLIGQIGNAGEAGHVVGPVTPRVLDRHSLDVRREGLGEWNVELCRPPACGKMNSVGRASVIRSQYNRCPEPASGNC